MTARPLVAPGPAGRLHRARLDNGLEVCVIENRQAPLVTVALCYRAGGRDEPRGQAGLAHFLEHMMFKGSSAYGPGEIDRRTQALGGSNNAFTTHDATAYYFNFSSDRWQAALDIEADRMRGLTLDPGEVDAERQVILEEIAMYRNDPWDSLAQRVHRRLFDGHPYGRPVLGEARQLAAVGAAELAAFHQRFYRPANAVLTLAGDVGEEAVEAVAQRFGGLEAGTGERGRARPARPPRTLERLEQRKGEVPRMMLALPAPAARDEATPVLHLLATLLGGGRTSRLHRRLVDEQQLCSMVAADFGETLDPGLLQISLELVPGVAPERAEAALFAELDALRERPPARSEIERGKRILLADWVFGHDRVHEQALTAAWALALYDLDHPRRQLQAALDGSADDLAAAAARLLPGAGSILGWSLPRQEGRR